MITPDTKKESLIRKIDLGERQEHESGVLSEAPTGMVDPRDLLSAKHGHGVLLPEDIAEDPEQGFGLNSTQD